MPGGGARGQNLEHLRFFFVSFFSCRKLFVFEQHLLFRVDSLCDLGFSALGVGQTPCTHNKGRQTISSPS